LLELLFIGFEHKLRIIVSSTSVQDLNRAAPAKFRTQIEQIQMHFEHLKLGSEQTGKFECFFSPSLRNLNACDKLKED
jgi:hypothetical protein